MRRFLKISLYTLLTLLVLIVAIPVTLYIPFVQNFACSQAVRYLNEQNDEMSFSVNKIRIGFPLSLKVYDVKAVSKQDGSLLFGLGKLQTGLDDFSLSDNKYLVKDFTLENISLGLDSLITSLSLKGNIGKLTVSDFQLDLNKQLVDVSSLVMESPDFAVWVGASEPDSLEEDTDFEWKISFKKILALNGAVKLDMSETRSDTLAVTKFFDYNHMNLTNLSLSVKDFVYAQDLISCEVRNVTGKEEHSVLEINRFKTNFLMQGNLIKAEDFELQMPKTNIAGDFATHLAILDSVRTDGFAKLDLKGNVAYHDLLAFAAPYLPEMVENWPTEDTRFSVNAYLTEDTLSVKDLSLKIDNHTDFKVEGTGQKIFDDERQVKAKIKGDLSDADFLLTTFVAKPEERTYRLPTGLFAEIDAQHWKKHTECEFFIQQDGVVVAEGNGAYDLITEQYKLNAKTDRLKLTDFVPMTGIDGLSTHINAEGRHFDFPGKYTSFDARVQLDTLLYNNGKGERDSLFDVSIDAKLKDSKYFAQISSFHPYITLDTQLEGDFAKDNVSAQGYIDLQRLDLMHLPQIVAADLGEIAMQSDIMASYDYGDNAMADILIHSFTYDDGERINPFDNIDIRFNSEPGRMEAAFESGDARLNLDADKGLSEIGENIDSLMFEVAHQLDSISLNLPVLQRHLPNLNADFSIARNNSFYPIMQLFGYRFQKINAKIRNAETLSVTANAYGLYLDETTRIDTIQFSLKPERNKEIYDYKLFANYLAPKAKDSYELIANGEIRRDSLTACLKYENGKYITVYDVDAAVALAYDTIRLHFIENPTIYAQHFNVNKDNFIQVSQFKDMASQALDIRANLDLDNESGLCVNLLTQKKDTIAGQDVRLRVENLDLAYLSETLDMGLDMGGQFNSEFFIELLPASLGARVNTEIESLHIGDYRADLLRFDGVAMRESKETFVLGDITIDDIVKLNLVTNIGDSLDVNLGINDFPLPLINGFLPQNIQLSGETRGEVTVKGKSFDNAQINGYLSMRDASANYADCDATIHFPQDTIRIRRNRLRFRNYALTAANKNKLALDGSVSFREQLDNPMIDLTLRGEKVQIFKNKGRKNKKQYICGTLPATVDMSIKGLASNLDIKGNISALEGTNLIYYLEEDPLSSASKVEELVDFVRFREIDRILPDYGPRPYRVAAKDEGVEVGLKLNIANNAKVYVHLPTNEQDHVNLVGGGSLQLTCEKNGSIVMSGMYDISGGDVHYKLPMIPMTKDFELSDRSWITWNGDVADPNINLIAVEKVRSTVNDERGSRVVTFDVTINIAGTLNQLDITFTCDAPDDGAIASEIASLTEEERSKQALLLLIAQTYMGPGNSSSMGLASANAALNSVLNKELESLLTGKMKHTDINVGIDTYDADGATRTDYSVKVSQRLFNDRMRVTVGGKISSGDNMEDGNSDAMINDVSLEYLTKPDGSSYVRLFRKTNYQNILEGEVVENGVGYVQQREGFRFKNLFHNSKKREAAIREQIKAMQEAERQEEREKQRRNNFRTQNERIRRTNTDSVSVAVQHVDSIAADSVQFNK